MTPIKLKAPLKDYLWGGTRLKTDFGKKTDLEKVAESWELSCREESPSIVASGPDEGLTLPEYLTKYGKEILGTKGAAFDYFPLLIKLIDARDNLSIQVHPDDSFALREEGEYGKTEMWYVADCTPGACLYYGLQREISREELKARIAECTLPEVLNRVPVRKGDVFFLSAGTLHAIGKGILVTEIQQNSNITYRVYDYGRVGADGRPRPLHIEKALQVARLEPENRKPGPQGNLQAFEGGEKILLASCPYFTAVYWNLKSRASLMADASSFQAVLMLEGEAAFCWSGGSLNLKKGESAFFPAGTGLCTIKGQAQFITSSV